MAKSRAAQDIPANFIVEFGTSDKPLYLVCQTTQIIPEGSNWGNLDHKAFGAYIARNQHRAAPLPGMPLAHSEFRSGPSK